MSLNISVFEQTKQILPVYWAYCGSALIANLIIIIVYLSSQKLRSKFALFIGLAFAERINGAAFLVTGKSCLWKLRLTCSRDLKILGIERIISEYSLQIFYSFKRWYFFNSWKKHFSNLRLTSSYTFYLQNFVQKIKKLQMCDANIFQFLKNFHFPYFKTFINDAKIN